MIRVNIGYAFSFPKSKRVRVIERQNVYWGDDSVLKMKLEENRYVDGQKVDTDLEFIAVAFSFFLDWITGKYVLSHYETEDGIPILISKKPGRFAGRLKVLYQLLDRIKKFDKIPKSELKEFLDEVSELIQKNDYEKAYDYMKYFAERYNVLDTFEKVKNKIINKKTFGFYSSRYD